MRSFHATKKGKEIGSKASKNEKKKKKKEENKKKV